MDANIILQQQNEEIKQLKEELNQQQETDYGSVYGNEKADSHFRFFREILHLPDTIRIGNLMKDEIRIINRDRKVAVLCETLKKQNVANYLRSRANVISETSMGRKGFWSQLFVTQIKKNQVVRDNGNGQQQKSGLFSRFKNNNSQLPQGDLIE